MMGVNYDLFWTLNPKSLSPFYKAFELSKNQQDEIAWQNGWYIRLAVASIIDSKVKYPTKPMSDTTVTIEEVAQAKMNKIKQKMLETMVVVNSKFTKEGDVINE